MELRMSENIWVNHFFANSAYTCFNPHPLDSFKNQNILLIVHIQISRNCTVANQIE